MAGLAEFTFWENEIYQLETTDRVVGGVNGISNRQAKQLANRTNYLRFKAGDAAQVVRGMLPENVYMCSVAGAVTTKVGNLYAVTAGFIYFESSIFQVDAHNLNHAGDVVWAVVNNKLVLQADSGQGIADFSILYSLRQYIENAAPVGKIEMFDAGFQYYNGTGAGFGPCLGWQICNGQNGAPDLRDRFIMGKETNATGQTGGANEVTLTALQSGLREHNHGTTQNSHSHTYSDRYTNEQSNTDAGSQTRRVQDNTETKQTSAEFVDITINNAPALPAAEAHENRPAFYTAAYRRKMSQ